MEENPQEKLEAAMLAAEMSRLFINRVDCYAIQTSEGPYRSIKEPLTDEVLNWHLKGEITVGSYQLSEENLVKWLCFDLDPEKLADPQLTARKLLSALFEEKTLEDGGKTPRVWPNCVLLEASRYPDPSYHIWVFFAERVEAKVARWLGLHILELANLSPKTIEVFPKQNYVNPECPFGNLVKLPLGFHQVERKWSRILDFNTFEPLPNESIQRVYGLSFSEKDIEKIESLKTENSIQATFEIPENFKPLSNKDQEKTVRFLCKYWKVGYRNDLTMSFCGMAIKKGVTYESSRRVISEVCLRTNTSAFDTSGFLQTVDYHYRNRLHVNLKGTSGIIEVLDKLRKKAENKQC